MFRFISNSYIIINRDNVYTSIIISYKTGENFFYRTCSGGKTVADLKISF